MSQISKEQAVKWALWAAGASCVGLALVNLSYSAFDDIQIEVEKCKTKQRTQKGLAITLLAFILLTGGIYVYMRLVIQKKVNA